VASACAIVAPASAAAANKAAVLCTDNGEVVLLRRCQIVGGPELQDLSFGYYAEVGWLGCGRTRIFSCLDHELKGTTEEEVAHQNAWLVAPDKCWRRAYPDAGNWRRRHHRGEGEPVCMNSTAAASLM